MADIKRPSFLEILLSGEGAGSGRIPVSNLLRLLTDFSKALHRTGMVLQGEADSIRRGPRQRSIADEIALDLVLLTHGSPDTVLGFERSLGQQSLEGVDFGLEIIQKTLQGLGEVQKEGNELPYGFDGGVLLAWRDVGLLFEKGIREIRFALNHCARPMVTPYTVPGFQRIKERIKGPQINLRAIEGRLLMADFKEHGTRCRVHPSVGGPILCLFGEAQKDEVLENILHYVRVTGEAKEDSITGKISTIKIHDIQRLEESERERIDLLPQGTPVPMDFWQSPSLDELAEAQGVQPLTDVSFLFGTWPGEDDDGFEETVDKLRLGSMAGGPRS